MGRRGRGRGVAGAAVTVARAVAVANARAVAAGADTGPGRRGVADAVDACAPAAATAARRHAVAAPTRVAGVAEASVRAVRLCAEPGGLVVITCDKI